MFFVGYSISKKDYELHSNTFANGQLLFTYDDNRSEWGVALSDWLGTKRVQVDPAIVANLTGFQSLPFGDGLTSSGYGEDSTEHHFTGKERDQESGNDYFGARYYASALGRFLSPDWSAGPDTVPYADLTNPQSLNLYSYVYNNPFTNVDLDGHGCQGNNAISTSIENGGLSDDDGIYKTLITVQQDSGDCGPSDSTPSIDETLQQIHPAQLEIAPSNVLTQIQRVYQSGCVGQALRSNAGPLLLDAAGVALTISPLGAEARVAGAIALGAASTVVGAVEANTTSTKGVLATAGAFANIFGIQTAPLELAEDFAQFSRGAGKLLTGVGIGADLASVGIEAKNCLGSQQ
jgi:RHS repeat-associated protein